MSANPQAPRVPLTKNEIDNLNIRGELITTKERESALLKR